ncbi:MAG: Stp1/IreP family PP2C-type Ser/Thr phosphatase [Clostridia bacterium]|nr:Stp1/IreP family PP2C-type Ser/Thr phosphatase [Clostridia bacterium]
MIFFHFESDIGKKRTLNEDSYGYCVSADGSVRFFIVADGMGGHNAGEIASKMAVDTFVEAASAFDATHIRSSSMPDRLSKFIKDTVFKIDRKIIKKSRGGDNCFGMGTTAVICAVFGRTVVIGNVGDSRAYIANKYTGIKQITVDHSYVEELKKSGYLTQEEVDNHPKKNAITRALGFLEEEGADVFIKELSRGERIILCTDGLTSMVSDEKISEIVNGNLFLTLACKKLVKCANENGGTDNITVAVIQP